MSALNRVIAGVYAVVCCVGSYGSANAEFTFLGPSPYLSAADSPFDLSGLGSTFFLEDFEDLNPSPGLGPFFVDTVRSLGNSVDADDGLIDGSGSQGNSAGSNFTLETGSSSTEIIRIDFDSAELGFLPTAVGIVLTQGAGSLSGIIAVDSDGNRATFSTADLNLSSLSTADDRFIGITNPHGIARVEYSKLRSQLIGNQPFPHLDHLQYGILVPEPSTGLVSQIAIALLLCSILFRSSSRNYHSQL